jgi:hypothetical protein
MFKQLPYRLFQLVHFRVHSSDLLLLARGLSHFLTRINRRGPWSVGLLTFLGSVLRRRLRPSKFLGLTRLPFTLLEFLRTCRALVQVVVLWWLRLILGLSIQDSWVGCIVLLRSLIVLRWMELKLTLGFVWLLQVRLQRDKLRALSKPLLCAQELGYLALILLQLFLWLRLQPRGTTRWSSVLGLRRLEVRVLIPNELLDWCSRWND